MAERSGYSPGTFSWADLSTSDVDGAKAFYGRLFGWDADDRPAGHSVYSMQTLGGRFVAAITGQAEAQRDAGVPPMWSSYVTVDDIEAVAARVGELGGGLHASPFDVFDAGRMAVATDPQGAFFMLWQPREHFGAGLVNAPGSQCWNELGTSDLDGAASFYRELFGWSTQQFENNPEPYLLIEGADGRNGGMRPAEPGMPPFWLVYFAVADLDAALASVAELGGSLHAGPIDIGVAKIAIVGDPQGAVFALYAGQLDP